MIRASLIFAFLTLISAQSTFAHDNLNRNYSSKGHERTGLADQNPNPNIFEATITASSRTFKVGKENIEVFAYNGQIPGPEIRVKRGDRVIIHLENKLPAGWPTTLHWHGIELNNASDGTTLTQDLVQPGESYTYDFIAPRAGVFWYHPHARGAAEVNAGLYAPLIVTQPEEKELVIQGKLPYHDETLVLSDIAIVDGKLKDPNQTPMLETMNGTEGNYLLVNGKVNPTIFARNGEALRLRLINASISRYFRLSLPGHDIYRVGGEGGLIGSVRLEGGPIMGMRMAMPIEITPDMNSDMNSNAYMGYTGPIQIDQGYDKGELLLAPAQRADVIVVPKAKTGSKITMKWLDFARGRHQMAMTPMGMMMTEADDDGLRPTIDLFDIKVLPNISGYEFAINEGDELVAIPEKLISERTDSQVKLQSDMMAMMSGGPKETWFKIDDYAGVEGRNNYRTAVIGETIEWETHNHTDMHHPFHLHGFSFQPTRFVKMNHDEGYMDMWSVNSQNEFIDTINVPPHTSVYYTFKIDERPEFGANVGEVNGYGAEGDWVFHCHIFQHGENGMMSFLRVE